MRYWAALGLSLALACHERGAEPTRGPGVADTQTDASPTTYPGALVDVARVSRDFLMRQKLDGRWREMRFSFEAVIQKQGEVLTVIGLTPFGTKAFVLTQTGTHVEFQKLVDRELPFPPEYILQDINRAFLYDAMLPWGRTGEPGDNDAQLHGERVRDRFEAGRLVARAFSRLDGQPSGEVSIEYGGEGMRDGIPPSHVVFRNGWFGYRLDIAVVAYQAL